MGIFGGSTKTTSNETFDSGPSSFQRPYLDQSFQGAQSAYDASKSTPYYQGSTYAGMSPEAKAALDAMRGFATGTGLTTANTLSSIGSSLGGYLGKSGDMLDQYTKMAGEDATASNIAAASKYAANPYLDAQIDANSRDVTRNLAEVELPGIDRAASAGGNINSSRAGIASGIAQRGAADRIADISATLRGNAYSQGLDRAQQDRQSRLDAYGTAASAYGNLGTTGLDALSKGAEAGYGAFDKINQAGALDQADRQGQADADFEKWQGQDQRPWDILDRYNSIVGGSQWGQSGTSTSKSKTKQSGSILSQLVGAASAAASVYTGSKK
jgi:hypothetical protein